MNVLSLCSGIGGLELAVGGDLVAVAETDPHPARILAHHFDAPNLGDWTLLDEFPDCDLITAGLPCQPVSTAGKQRADKDDRWLFDDFTTILAAGHGRPALFLENVRGILFPRVAVAFRRFIETLADLGYILDWEVVRASDAGAPHRRERWFCLAEHGDTDSMVRTSSVAVGYWFPGGRIRQLERTRPGPSILGDTDSESVRRNIGSVPRPETQERQDGSVGHGSENAAPTVGDTDSEGPQRRPIQERTSPREQPAGPSGMALRQSKYGPAVARWEQLTRPAPDPLNDGRLNAAFAEWMMGLPAGWVTDHATNNQALKMIGNAVCPQQAALALEVLTYEKGTNHELDC